MIQSVDRALHILDLLKNNPRGLGVTEISKSLDVAKSTAHRLLMSLERYGYVQKFGKDAIYRLGLKFIEMNQVVVENLNVVEIARPYLEKLSADTGEIVHLVMLDGYEIVYIDKVDNNSTIRIYSQIGRRAQLHCTGVGKAILAHFDKSNITRFIENNDFRSYTPNTIVDGQALLSELEKIRIDGISFDNEEHEPGIQCVAAPIKDHRNHVQYAISVTGPLTRMTKEKLETCIPKLRETAQNISRQLGHFL
ncbi:MAG TPA: IclR family transcriptional regulator [Bacillus sp. (in: firmicutes)]|uniref:IclR family transcriptional regulator n=1 Tax=Bacillus litorisediminis TaxID=2922713 RepID=UPI001FAE1FEC|nr:IclR family transcriptional regulator [Bacillus litorisediminis]HWO74504.1 IclR family transcriptional regulator [Bacillus sp. (in: firmicutes)]